MLGYACGMQFPAANLLRRAFYFAICAAVVWIAGTRLAYLADALADRFRLAKSLVGLLLLSLAASLPDVATILAAAVGQESEVVLNNLFGGITLQMAILAIPDFWARGP